MNKHLRQAWTEAQTLANEIAKVEQGQAKILLDPAGTPAMVDVRHALGRLALALADIHAAETAPRAPIWMDSTPRCKVCGVDLRYPTAKHIVDCDPHTVEPCS